MKSKLPIFLPGLLVAASCVSLGARTFTSPTEATAAIVESVDEGERQEASRIFDTFARGSTQREQVYAELFGTAEQRYRNKRAEGAADVLEFVCAKYPGAVNAREALVYARFMERAENGVPKVGQAEAMEAAIADYRSVADRPSAFVDLALVQLAIDDGDLGQAREDFRNFLGTWDGGSPEIMLYVEDLGRYLETH